MKSRKTLTIISVCLAVCLLLSAVVVCLHGRKGASVSNLPAATGAEGAKSYAEIYDTIKEMSESGNIDLYNGMVFKEATATVDYGAASNAAVTDAATAAPAADGYSTTNVQVEGVDEGDIIKNDGQYIYILRGGKLIIVEAQSLTELCCVEVGGEKTGDIREMFLCGDRLCFISSYYPYYLYLNTMTAEEEDTEEPCTKMLIYDISDRKAPVLADTLSQSGSYVSARLTGDILYTVTTSAIYDFTVKADVDKPETFVPCVGINGTRRTVSCTDVCIMETPSTAEYTVVTAASLENGRQFSSVKASLGGSGTVYATADSLIVAGNRSDMKEETTVVDGKNAVVQSSSNVTDIMLFSLDNGVIAPKAQGSIPGYLINQFAIDEYNGCYRFVTTDNVWVNTIFTDGIDTYDYSDSSTSGLYVLDDTLNIVGKIDGLAEDERVQSVRFYGDTGYFVTFRQTDPLFSVDLSEPANPRILSTLKIPGFSSYMHAYGDGRLFGLGFDADEETGMTQGLKLSMFDVSDPSAVTEKHKLVLKEGWSEATYNHKAILISTEKNLIAFPADEGYVIYGYDEDNGFFLKNKAELEDWSAYESRGLFIGDRFYVCSDKAVSAFDINTFGGIDTLTLSIASNTN